jgi:hypothetical protein
MCDPLLFRGKKLLKSAKKQLSSAAKLIKNHNLLFVAIGMMSIGGLATGWNFQSTSVAQAASLSQETALEQLDSPLFEKKAIFPDVVEKTTTLREVSTVQPQVSEFEKSLLSIVGDTPIAEMVPFIAKRDNKVAAFLVGIAKKESSFGLASPSKNGNDCHNYWGYKGVGSRGEVEGYSCFASAQEAIETVGDRIETLVGNDRNTPAKMVDTWKCGRSCAGDPGAPSWVSTVALYFDEIVKNEG